MAIRPATPAPARPKVAVLTVNRFNDGVATYALHIDGVAQELSSNSAHWDDASPWLTGSYALAYEPLHRTWPAWLVRRVQGREAIKIHQGSRTDHSQGCIVFRQTKIAEILQVLKDNDIDRGAMRLRVNGVADLGFRIEAKSLRVPRGGRLSVEISLSGPMSNDGVSKDIWIHVNPDGSAVLNVDFAPTDPQPLPSYNLARGSRNYPVDGPGFWVKIPKGESVVTVAIDIEDGGIHRLPKTVKFQIDGYKIVNQSSRGPEFYTPSNYRAVLNLVRFNRNFVQITDR